MVNPLPHLRSLGVPRWQRLAIIPLLTAAVVVGLVAVRQVGPGPLKLASSTQAYGAGALPSAPTGKTFLAPPTIAADCSSDVTASLNSWIASVPDNSTMLLRSGACYHVEGVLVISGKQKVAMVGNGSVMVSRTNASQLRPQIVVGDLGIAHSWPDSRDHVMIMNSSDVTVRGLALRGSAANSDFVGIYADQNAFNIRNDSRVLVDGVKADHVYGDFVAVTQASSNVTVQNSTFKTSGRNCMSVYWGDYVTFQHNTMADCHFVNFDIEPIHPTGPVWWSARHLLITHNDVTGSSFFSNEGNLGSPTGFIELSYNTVHSVPLRVIVGGGTGDPNVVRHNYRIIGNTSDMIEGVDFRGMMTFTGVQGLVVQGNTQKFQSPLPKGQVTDALVVTNSSEVVVTGNAFSDVSHIIGVPAPSIRITHQVAAGAQSVTTTQWMPTLEGYQIDTGAGAEMVTVRYVTGTGPYTLVLGYPLAHAHAVGAAIGSSPNGSVVSAPNRV